MDDKKLAAIPCPTCKGTGKEICDNPDHCFIDALSFHDIGRIGCPCCGHDPNHAIPKTVCGMCNGRGELTEDAIAVILAEVDRLRTREQAIVEALNLREDDDALDVVHQLNSILKARRRMVAKLEAALQQYQAREGAYQELLQDAWDGYCKGDVEKSMHKLKDTARWLEAQAQGRRSVVIGHLSSYSGVPKEKWPICPKCGKKELSLIHGIADGEEKYLCYECWRELEQALAGGGGAS